VARIDFTTRRLFVEAPLHPGGRVALAAEQAHYLRHVLRLTEGSALLVFNGRDGEWRAHLTQTTHKSASLAIAAQTREQPGARDVHLLFAPLKQARLDYMVQKAVEMGVSRLVPVLTQHTQVTRINLDRMRSNTIEAAEQCGILLLPDLSEQRALSAVLATWPRERLMIFCDEDSPVRDPVTALSAYRSNGPEAMALIIGPEGGFDSAERAAILSLPDVVRLSLGPRILRADTAAVAALGLVQAVLGDWR
jgi:16S rRNA (uracil1498-N3)-methyltransferase